MTRSEPARVVAFAAAVSMSLAVWPVAGQAPESLPTGLLSPRPPGCTKNRPTAVPANKVGPLDDLLALYERQGVGAIETTVTSERMFDRMRSEIPATTSKWEASWRPMQALFLLEFAKTAFEHRWFYWIDALDLARRFVTSRPNAPGANAAEDEFELRWHKTSLALLGLSRRPELIEDCGVLPLLSRIAPSAERLPNRTLVDPWIALVAGTSEEFWTIWDPSTLPTRGPRALQHFDEASGYQATRAEALVRTARVLIRLERFHEAIVALDEAGEPENDVYVSYWARLFRGAASAGEGDLTRAAEAYRAALIVEPGAQSALVGLMALSFTHDDLDEAYRRAADVKAPGDGVDPWWEYGYGDRRFLDARLEWLREAARR